jgi:TonB family protein
MGGPSFRRLALAFCWSVLLTPLAASAESGNSGDKERFEVIDESIRASDCEEITPPRVKIRVTPKYPKEASKAGKKGKVVLVARLTREAKLEELKVQETDDEVFNEASLVAVRKWIFEPALCDGRPVEVRYTLTVNFRGPR